MADEDAKIPLFDRYDSSAVLVPGATLLIGGWLLYGNVLPEPIGTLELKDLSLGALGVFAIAAYCAGHLVQVAAGLITELMWRIPNLRKTESMFDKGKGLADAQVDAILPQLNKQLKITLTERPKDHRRAYTAQIATAVGTSSRLLTFNANFGMFRGLALALLVLAVTAFVQDQRAFGAAAVLIALLALIGAKTFSDAYARELWNLFLLLP